jgi:hypothetical protein
MIDEILTNTPITVKSDRGILVCGLNFGMSLSREELYQTIRTRQAEFQTAENPSRFKSRAKTILRIFNEDINDTITHSNWYDTASLRSDGCESIESLISENQHFDRLYHTVNPSKIYFSGLTLFEAFIRLYFPNEDFYSDSSDPDLKGRSFKFYHFKGNIEVFGLPHFTGARGLSNETLKNIFQKIDLQRQNL